MPIEVPDALSSVSNVPGIRTIQVFGNAMMPLYRHGDHLIVSDTAPIKVGDRIIAKKYDAGLVGGTLIHQDQRSIALHPGGRTRLDIVIARSHLEFVGRVIWASQ